MWYNFTMGPVVIVLVLLGVAVLVVAAFYASGNGKGMPVPVDSKPCIEIPEGPVSAQEILDILKNPLADSSKTDKVGYDKDEVNAFLQEALDGKKTRDDVDNLRFRVVSSTNPAYSIALIDCLLDKLNFELVSASEKAAESQQKWDTTPKRIQDSNTEN